MKSVLPEKKGQNQVKTKRKRNILYILLLYSLNCCSLCYLSQEKQRHEQNGSFSANSFPCPPAYRQVGSRFTLTFTSSACIANNFLSIQWLRTGDIRCCSAEEHSAEHPDAPAYNCLHPSGQNRVWWSIRFHKQDRELYHLPKTSR